MKSWIKPSDELLRIPGEVSTSGVIISAALAIVMTTTGCGAARTPPSAPAPLTELRRAIDSMVADTKFRSAQLGILVVDPVRGDTLYSHNAGKLFIPASNQKLVTGAVALQTLGADFRFTTTVAMRGAMGREAGVLDGDLVLIGTGDPSVSDHVRGDAMIVLRGMADSLWARGIRRVTGRLTSALDAFPDATLGFGWSWDDLDYPYAAGVDELYLNEGFTQVIVRGGATAGDAPIVVTGPAATYPLVQVWATTGAAATKSSLWLMHDSATAGSIVLLGSIGAGGADTLTITYRDQTEAYLSALREALQLRGILVEGGVHPTASPVWSVRAPNAGPPMEPPYTPLFSMVSPPLREILGVFEKPSQNQIGEILFKTLGRSRTGVGSADSGRTVVRAQLLAWGAPQDGFVVRDGSGLSRQDVVTPETLARVLDAMRRHTSFAVFYDALPIAGVDGTLAGRMRGTAAQGNVHAKTGTLDLVRSLSGYVTTGDGHQLIAVMLANNWTVSVREVERLQDAIFVRLAQLRLGDR
ncbi:MAG: D-alanyl-D-alanine carboxypeptidase/D-alanyl-D-alanine-endopeptidase [Gemmatimonadaceae bacterium]